VPEASDDTATCRFPGSDSFVAIPLVVSELQFFSPLLLFARGSPLFLDVIAVAEQCFQKFPSTSIFFGLLHLLQSDFLFCRLIILRRRIRTFPFGAHVTFVVLLTAGHSSGMG